MRAALPALVLALVVAACGGDGSGVPTVSRPLVASVRVSDPPATVKVGQSLQLTATALDASGASVVNPGPFQWSSGAPQVAMVDATGKVSTLIAGTTSISAKVAGVTGTTSLSVVPAGQQQDTVSTLPLSFVPNQLTVPIGSTVVFAFGGGISHNVIFKPGVAGAPTDIQETKDKNVARTFDVRGAFKYDCLIHPGMSGEIDVQ
jgi:plastocyanin